MKSPLGLSFEFVVDVFVFRAGVEAGVYLSRYQRPISAQYGLRAR